MDSPYSGTKTLENLVEAKNYNLFLLSRLLKEKSSEVSSVLDFGAGLGTFARMLKNNGLDVQCVEIDKAQRFYLKNNFITYSSLDDVKDDSFSFIYSLNVLEHIEDDRSALRSLFKKLATGGVLYLYLPAFPTLYSSFDKKIGHFRRYTKQDLLGKLKEANFQILSCDYYDPLGFFAAYLYKLIDNGSGSVDFRKIILFDKYIFPISRLLHLFTKNFFGKNIEIIAKKI